MVRRFRLCILFLFYCERRFQEPQCTPTTRVSRIYSNNGLSTAITKSYMKPKLDPTPAYGSFKATTRISRFAVHELPNVGVFCRYTREIVRSCSFFPSWPRCEKSVLVYWIAGNLAFIKTEIPPKRKRPNIRWKKQGSSVLEVRQGRNRIRGPIFNKISPKLPTLSKQLGRSCWPNSYNSKYAG